MNILITGAKGQLGTELSGFFKRGATPFGTPSFLKGAHRVVETDADELDITDRKAVLSFCEREKIDVVFNCAAYTNVNKAESDEALAFAVNAAGAENLALAMHAAGGRYILVSTDYVFDGGKGSPYVEEDACRPLGVYGRSKRLGEELSLKACPNTAVMRTAWLYGRSGNNFLKTVQRVCTEKGAMRVVNDQFGSPTFTEDLAYHMLLLADRPECGVFHATCEGVCTWYEFAAEIARLSGIAAQISPCTTEEYPTPVRRPAYSVLENARLKALGLNFFRSWRQALSAYFAEN